MDDAETSRLRSNPMGLVATIGLTLLVGSAVLLPLLARAKETSRRERCRANLKAISEARERYFSDHGFVYPDRSGRAMFAQIQERGYVREAETFGCPSSGAIYRGMAPRPAGIEAWHWNLPHRCCMGCEYLPIAADEDLASHGDRWFVAWSNGVVREYEPGDASLPEIQRRLAE